MKLAFKVDVDTLAGTKVGVVNLLKLFVKYEIPATFLFSLGKDQMGRSIFRIFQKGFLKKCLRSNVVGNYSLRTLLSGTVLPSVVISEKCADVIKLVDANGFECGVHCLNHYKWQNFLHKMSEQEVRSEFGSACKIFEDVLGYKTCTSGAAGWQVCASYFRMQDEYNMLYASDTRGESPFLARIGDEVFKTIQIPTTLFTLDELLVSNVLENIADVQITSIKQAEFSVMTIHAELEGMAYLSWFEAFLKKLKLANIEFFGLKDYALSLKSNREKIRVCNVAMADFYNRSGLIAIQK